jgi:hypothetical protein
MLWSLPLHWLLLLVLLWGQPLLLLLVLRLLRQLQQS